MMGRSAHTQEIVTNTNDVTVFIKAVGSRVRKARMKKAISRRALSELSGISQRYLAQLESGSGNISIALLFRVAHALGCRIEWLVGEGGIEQSTSDRHQRFCLIGLRGAGKSTLGRLTGEALAMPFHELNSDIEDFSGMPVDEVMALYGQEGYRELERQALEHIVQNTNKIILAVAGGIVSESETYAFLLRNFHTIWLRATPQDHMHRVRAQGDERPMTGNPKAMEDLVSILTSRETLYARARSKVDTSGHTVNESLQQIVAAIEQIGILTEIQN